MSEFICGECRGGFPEPVKWQGKYVCPWCYTEILRRHEVKTPLERLFDGGG